MKKSITHILPGEEKPLNREEKVLQLLPHKEFGFANPFIVLHHQFPKTILPGAHPRISPHADRAIDAAPFMLQAACYHKDNSCDGETINPGDVQWVVGGKELLHSEGSSVLILANRVQEFIRLWINVPKHHTWDHPSYQSFTKDQMPIVLQQDGVNLRLVSGEYDGVTGPMKTLTPIVLLFGEIEKGRRLQFTALPGYRTFIYIIKGKLCINQETVNAQHLVVFEKENDEIIVCTEEHSQVLFLSAQPIVGPVSAGHNFIMNKQEERKQAIAD